jgi:hypothetical protein
VQPVDTSNSVELLYRVNRGQARAVAAKWLWNDSFGDTQYFRASFPASTFRAGDTVEYTPICRCAGRQVPSPEEAAKFTASFKVVEAGVEPALDRASEGSASSEPYNVSGSRRDAIWPVEAVSQTVAPAPSPLGASATQASAPGNQELPPSYEVRREVTHDVARQLPNQEAGAPLADWREPTFVNTGVRYNNRRVYRLIGRTLYSAPTDKPLEQQEYTVEKSDMAEAPPADATWQVMVRDGEVCLRIKP